MFAQLLVALDILKGCAGSLFFRAANSNYPFRICYIRHQRYLH